MSGARAGAWKRREELRDDAVEVWGLLDELLLHAEANGDATVLTRLQEAATAVLRVERLMTARERWNRGRRPLTAGELAILLRRLDGLAALARRAHARKAAALVATAQARVAYVAELVMWRGR